MPLMSGGDAVVSSLLGHGISTIYCLPGVQSDHLFNAMFDAGDGQGLNPLLQYWTMVIHPPMLYLGYVGFAVPFAFAIASLITKQPGEAWIHTTRRWTLVTWLFQSSGILLGAGWAYAVLG